MFVLADISCFNALRDIDGQSHACQEFKEAGLSPRGKNYDAVFEAGNRSASNKQLNADDRRFIADCLRACRLGQLKPDKFRSLMKGLGIKKSAWKKVSPSGISSATDTGKSVSSETPEPYEIFPNHNAAEKKMKSCLRLLGLYPALNPKIYPNLITRRNSDSIRDAEYQKRADYYQNTWKKMRFPTKGGERDLGMFPGKHYLDYLHQRIGSGPSATYDQAVQYARRMLSGYDLVHADSDAVNMLLERIKSDIQRM